VRAMLGIIGAGAAGICAAKYALDENCFDQIHLFEKDNCIGGMWNNANCGWDALKTNLSASLCRFDGLMHEGQRENEFIGKLDMGRYLEKYAEVVGIEEKCIVHKNCRVENVEFDKDLQIWRVFGNGSVFEFKFICICSGFFSKGVVPFEIQQLGFSGKILHASEVLRMDDFKGKNVVVIGNAFSGADLAVEFTNVCKNVVSIPGRRKFWFISRYINGKTFNEIAYNMENFRNAPKNLSEKERIRQRHAKLKFLAGRNPGSIHEALQVDEEKDLPFAALSDGYLDKIDSGEIIIKTSIQSAENRTLTFQDSTKLDIDAIICATGYKLNLDFLAKDILDCIQYEQDNMIQPAILYKTVFPPKPFPNIAFIGIYRGVYFPVMELQAKWAMAVFSGKQSLPNDAIFNQGLADEQSIREISSSLQFPHGDFISFALSLASELGMTVPSSFTGELTYSSFT
jgi:dimethylaniline monooxygenase (N-oxide forming)